MRRSALTRRERAQLPHVAIVKPGFSVQLPGFIPIPLGASRERVLATLGQPGRQTDVGPVGDWAYPDLDLRVSFWNHRVHNINLGPSYRVIVHDDPTRCCLPNLLSDTDFDQFGLEQGCWYDEPGGIVEVAGGIGWGVLYKNDAFHSLDVFIIDDEDVGPDARGMFN